MNCPAHGSAPFVPLASTPRPLQGLNIKDEILTLRIGHHGSTLFVRVFSKCACCSKLLDHWIPLDLSFWN